MESTAIRPHVSAMPASPAHVDIGLFRGAEIADPAGLLEGTGRFTRHAELGPGRDVDERALRSLIEAAYLDMRRRLHVAPR